MNTVTVTETKNQVTVNETTNTVTVQEGVATVVTVKTEGPQGPAFSDGDKGDITVANNGTSVTVNSGVIDNANIASNAAIDLTKLATGALPTAITVTSANISDLSIVNADINASAAIDVSKLSGVLPSAGGTLTGNLTLSAATPRVAFRDTDSDSDFEIINQNGVWKFRDTTNNALRFSINSNGVATFAQNLNADNGLDVTGNITVTGTVDGRDVATDGTKLDGIETGATADQTASEILTLIKTVDGSGSGLNADLLDGINGANFLRSDTSDTMNGDLTLSGFSPDLNFVSTTNNPDWKITNYEGTLILFDITNNANKFLFRTDEFQSNVLIDAKAGIDVTGNLTVSGDLTVSGTTTTIDTTTLTVEDKNIELGKVSTPTDTTADGGGLTLKGATDKTFQWLDATDSWTSSEHIALPDNKMLQLGSSQDLQIYHDGTHSYINESGTGRLFINTSKFTLRNSTSTENVINATPNAAVELYYDNSKKFETTSTGVSVTGDLSITQNLVHTGDTDTKLQFGTDSILFNTAGTTRLSLTNSSATFPVVINANETGNNKGIRIHSNGGISATDNVLRFNTGQTNGFSFCTNSDGTSSNERLKITSDGNLQIPADNAKLQLGASQDLQIFHDGDNTFIENNSGNLFIRGVDNKNIYIQARSGENSIFCQDDGTVELYFNNSKKFETTSTGITATGSEHKFVNNSTGDLKLILEADTGNSDENNNPYILFRQDGGGFGDFSVIGNNPQGINTENNALVLANSTNAQGGIIFKTGDTNGYANATEKFRVNTTGILATGAEHKFTSGTSGDCTVIIEADTGNSNEDNNPKLLFRQDGGLDLGSIGMNFSNSSSGGTNNQLYIAASTGDAAISFLTGTTAGYTNASERLKITHDGNVEIPVDSKKLLLGASQDLQLVHTGTDSFVSHTTGSGVLRLNTSTGGEIHITKGGPEYMGKFIPDGAVELYFDNVKKLDTKSWGVFVHGSLVSTGLIKVGSYTDKFLVGENNEFSIQHDDTNTILENTAGNIQFITTSTGQLRVRGHAYIFNSHNDQEGVIKAYENAQVELYYDGVKKLETTSTGIATDDVRLAGMKFPKDQPNNGIDFMHLGHGGASGFGELDCFTGMMRIKANEVQLANRFGNVEMLTCNAFGSVEAYHNGTKRIETTSTGVDVNGKVSENGVTITSKATALSLVFS